MSKIIKSLITIALFSQPLTMYSAVYSSPHNLVEVVNKNNETYEKIKGT
jgi:hypothetical protein